MTPPCFIPYASSQRDTMASARNRDVRSAIDKEYEDSPISADEERWMILGYAVQWLLEEVPNGPLSEQILAFIDLYLDDPRERALFNLCPRLDYSDKLLPLKRPRDETP
jgi:hypothetical protein